MQVEPAQVEGHDRTGHGAGDDPAAVVAQQRHQLLDPGATGDVGHRIQPVRHGRGDLLGEIAGIPGHDVRRAGVAHRAGLGAAGDGHDIGAAGGGQLHQGQADATGGTGDQHRLAGSHAPLARACPSRFRRPPVGTPARSSLNGESVTSCACVAGTTT